MPPLNLYERKELVGCDAGPDARTFDTLAEIADHDADLAGETIDDIWKSMDVDDRAALLDLARAMSAQLPAPKSVLVGGRPHIQHEGVAVSVTGRERRTLHWVAERVGKAIGEVEVD